MLSSLWYSSMVFYHGPNGTSWFFGALHSLHHSVTGLALQTHPGQRLRDGRARLLLCGRLHEFSGAVTDRSKLGVGKRMFKHMVFYAVFSSHQCHQNSADKFHNKLTPGHVPRGTAQEAAGRRHPQGSFEGRE